jgi:ubiquinone/menaquinone biosynthesis C-methylase UbiE
MIDSSWIWMARQATFAVPAALLMRAVHMTMAGPVQQRPPADAIEALRASWVRLMRDDVHDAEVGVYPSSLLTLPTGTVLPLVPEFLWQLPVVARRARRRDHTVPEDDGLIPLPDYYRRAFHWQSDGWLSDKSARLYEPSVELLFAGAAGPMRRRALRPLVDALRGVAGARVLDLACGAGGFLSQLSQALPLARLSGVDLSSSYISHARRALAKAGTSADLFTENAESLPMKDGLYDAVSCIFLFHELPRDARRRIAAEMHRVLRVGGTVVVVDAAQEHSTPMLKPFLDFFPSTYHEPYFRSYQQDPIEDVLLEVGFQVVKTSDAFVSRVVVARRV